MNQQKQSIKQDNSIISKIFKYILLSCALIFVFSLYYTYFSISISPRYYIIKGSSTLSSADIALSFALLFNASSMISKGNSIYYTAPNNLQTMPIYTSDQENAQTSEPTIQEVTKYSLNFLGSDFFSLKSCEIFCINLVDKKYLTYVLVPVYDGIACLYYSDLCVHHVYNYIDNTISFYPKNIFGFNIYPSCDSVDLNKLYKMIIDSIDANKVFYIDIDSNLYKIIKN